MRNDKRVAGVSCHSFYFSECFSGYITGCFWKSHYMEYVFKMGTQWDQTVHQHNFKWRNVIKKLLTPLFRMLLSIHPSIDFHSQLNFYLCFIIFKIVVIGYWYWMLTAFSLIKSGNYLAFWTPIWQSAGHFMQTETVMRCLGLVKCIELPLLMVST